MTENETSPTKPKFRKSTNEEAAERLDQMIEILGNIPGATCCNMLIEKVLGGGNSLEIPPVRNLLSNIRNQVNIPLALLFNGKVFIHG